MEWFGSSGNEVYLADSPGQSEIETCLRNSSQRGDVVLDLFGGSGSTLIACHRLGRRGCLMEIDPRYCDVIRSRWRRFSGQGEA